jgi:hypothetical protein
MTSLLGSPLLNLTRLHLGTAHESQFQGLGIRVTATMRPRIMQTGWFKEVLVKDLDSHSVRALLASRALLVKIKRDLENQIRGLLKTTSRRRSAIRPASSDQEVLGLMSD